MEPEFDIEGLDLPDTGTIPEFDIELGSLPSMADLSTSVRNQMKSEISLTLDIDPLEVDQQVEGGFVKDLETRVRATNLLNFRNNLKFDIVSDLMMDRDLTVLSTDVEAEMRELEVGLQPSAASAIYRSDEENIFKNVNRLTLYRLERFKRIAQEKFETSEGGFWNGLGYFLDTVASVPKDVLKGGGFRRANLAEEAFRIASDPNLKPEEADRLFREMLDEVADTGMFSDNNWFYTGQFIEDFVEGGGTVDKLFTVFDLAAGAPTVARGLIKIPFKLRKTTDVAAATGEHGDVVRQIEGKIATTPDDVELAPTLSPAVERPMDTGFINGFFSAPGRQFLVDKELEWRLSEIVTKRDFGYFIQPEVWQREAPVLLEKLHARAKELGSNRLIEYNVDDGLGFNGGQSRLGNPLGIAVYGTTKGKFYTPTYKFKAQVFADEIGGEVVEVLQEGRTMYAVRKEWNLPTDKLFDPIKDSEITTNFFQLLGSTYLTTSQRLDRIMKRGESQLGATFQEVFKDYNKLRRAASKDTRVFVDDIFTELRDGVEAERRAPLSMYEFRSRFFQKFNKSPTPADENYFRAISDINNAAYLLLADQHFKRAVNAGGRTLIHENGARFVVFPATEARITREGLDKPVWNLDTGKPMDLPEGDLKGVYEVHEGFEAGRRGTYQYVFTEGNNFRRLYHDDVLGYNVGGPRVYDEFKFFVGQKSNVPMAGQSRTATVERITLGARTEKEARRAVDEINTLFRAIRDRVVPTGSRFNDLQRVRSLSTDAEFNTVVARNTLWNDDINSVDELVDFLEDQKLDYGKDVSFKGNRERLQDELNFFTADGEAETGIEFMRKVSFRTRGDKPLIGYGGKKASTLPPHVAVERNFTRQLTAQANAAYMKNAVQGWLAGADEAGVLGKVDKSLSPLDQLLNAKVNTSTKTGRAFEQERNVIRRRIANEDGFTRHWRQLVSNVADWVYNKGAQRMGVSFENMFSENPLHSMRSMAFNLKLGLFAFDQLLVQSNQAVNVVAIGGANGLRGAALTWPLQIAMYNGTAPVAKHVGKKIAGMVGLKQEDFVELVEFMKDSGRFAVGREVAEQDMNFRLAQGVSGRVLEAGRVFFNEGERFARTSAAAVAYLDFKRQFPGVSALDPQAKLWLSGRMDALTAGMTSSSATAWQRNSMTAVPLQFMSYTSRMTEQLFSDRILTVGERARLASAQTVFWGLTGVGLGWAADIALSEDITQMNPSVYTALRYGALDYIIGETTGAKTAFAERLAFPDAIYQLIEDATEESIIQTLGGPSLQVGSSLTGDMMLLIGDAVHGRYELVEHDFTVLAKNLAVVSRTTQAYHLYTMGKYYSRRGDEVADGFNKAEAFFALMGAPLQDVSFAYEQNIRQRDREKALNEIGFLIQSRMNLAIDKIAQGDEDGGKAMVREVASMVTVYDPMDQDYLTRFLKPSTLNLLEKVIQREIQTMENDNLLRARALGE